MFSIIKFEFKKLAKKKLNIIAILVSIIITSIFSILTISRIEYFSSEGINTGFKAIELQKQDAKNLSVKLTEDRITNDIQNYQKLFSNSENTIKNENGELVLRNDIYRKYVSPKSNYLQMLSYNYCEPGNTVFDFSNLRSIELENGAKFYETINNKISTFLNMNHKGGNYSENEKKFWLDKTSKIKTPYTYGYYKGWDSVNEFFKTLVFTLLAIIIIVAPIFSGEYQSGADAIILSSKYGKTKIIEAKIITAIAVATIIFILNIILALAIPLLIFGTSGWNLPIQIKDTLLPIPYSLTFFTSVLLNIGISYIFILGSVALTLLLSAIFKTPFTVLIVQVAILFTSLFISKGADNGLYNHILYLLPGKVTACDFSTYLSYSFGGIIISLLLMKVIVYGGMTIVCLVLSKNVFRKHQVQ